ncbi:MAG: radical SAM protein, partial [Spirochaetota bacterium]
MYGLESCSDITLERINRQHDFATGERAILRTHELGIRTGAHFIFGLPGETEEQMLASAD